MLTLSADQQQAIQDRGIPAPVLNPATGETYALLSIEITANESEEAGFTASIPGIGAFGEGETEEEAVEALMAALYGLIEMFGEQ